MKDQLPDAVIAAAAQKGALIGSGAAFWGGITANTVAAIGGLFVAMVGLGIQWYYRRKADRRAEEIHRLNVDKRLLHPYEEDA